MHFSGFDLQVHAVQSAHAGELLDDCPHHEQG